ncbi:MAG: Uma2 family endonuclease [Egibacteraceae bacterium]
MLDRFGLYPEIIGGELVIRGSPSTRHQRAVTRLVVDLGVSTDAHGSAVLTGPFGVELDPDNSTRPDVAFVRADRVDLIADDGLHVTADLLVEVTSPGSASIDHTAKRDIYQRLGVVEYWVVDLEADRVLVHRLGEAGYGQPSEHTRGDVLEPVTAPGLTVAVARLLDA